MTALLSHRGPDDSGGWVGEDVVLGHRRLSILDLSAAGRQPMAGGSGRFVVTYNGEIYNYLELREVLGRLGHRFRTGTDTEVLLAAYMEWGEGCLDRINGMWAFAVWDTETRTLFAARDRMGEKPFYYVEHRGRLYFASEIKALLLIPGLSRTLNPQAVVDFAAERVSNHSAETFIREIRQLLPATLLLWRDGEVHTRSYWTVSIDPAPATNGDLEEIAHLLQDAVRLRLRADTAVGCLVSGGLDSSTIAGIAREQFPGDRPVHVFTTLTDPPNEEAEGVERLLRRTGFEPHFHTPTARTFWEDLPGVLWHQEQPFGDASMAAHYALMREARRADVPVLLSGQGADELFAGYTTYPWVHLGAKLRAGRWRGLLRHARNVAAHQRLGPALAFARIGFHALPQGLRSHSRRFGTLRRLDWLNTEWRSRFVAREQYATEGSDGLHAYLWNSIRYWTLPGFLHYEDRNSMAFGVETRLPFLDHRLVEKLFRVSPDDMLRNGETKSLLRQIARPFVPREIVERKAKQGYPAPLAAWLRTLATEVRDLAYSPAAKECPILNTGAWHRKVEAFLSGASGELDPVWRGMICVLWHQQVFQASETDLRRQADGSSRGRIRSQIRPLVRAAE